MKNITAVCIVLFNFWCGIAMSQNPIRFGIKVDSINCKYITILDSTSVVGERRIDMGDGSFKDNNLDLNQRFPFDHYMTYPLRHRYVNNGTYTLKYTVKYYDSIAMIYKTDSLKKSVTIQCDSCSFKADFNFMFTTADPSLAYLNSFNKGFPYVNHWTLGDGDSSSLDSFLHKYKDKGKKRIKLVTSFYDSFLQRYCVDSAFVTIWSNNTMLSGLTKEYKVNAYPNPFGSQLKLENKSDEEAHVTVYDMTGKSVAKYTIPSLSELLFEDLGWSPGMYLLKSDHGEMIRLLKE